MTYEEEQMLDNKMFALPYRCGHLDKIYLFFSETLFLRKIPNLNPFRELREGQ